MASQNGSFPSPAGSNRTPNNSAHGGSIDPFATSFNGSDGTPTQANYGAQPGTPVRSSNISAHGGSFDPFAMSFDNPNGIPTQGTYGSQNGASIRSVPVSSPTQSQGQSTRGISRVPVGARATHSMSKANYQMYNPSKAQVVSSDIEVSPVFQESNVGGNPNSQPQTQKPVSHDVERGLMSSKEGINDDVVRIPLKGYLGNFFSKTSQFRLRRSPHSIQKPGYSNPTETNFRHRDGLRRVYKGKLDDRYLDPLDGRVRDLVVQCTDSVYRGPRNSTYQRTFIRNVAPISIRIASWPTDHLGYQIKGVTSKPLAYFLVAVKWPITCYVLYHVIGIPGLSSTGTVVNGGCYDPFPYRFWGFCKVARNSVEQGINNSLTGRLQPSSRGSIISNADNDRILEPEYLCFVTDEQYGRRRSVLEWKNDRANQHHHGKCPEYLFIAYTTEHFNHNSLADIKALHEIATKAARDAGLTAYWIGASCMQEDDIEDDVFRISDIVRGAHSLVIAIGSGLRDIEGHATTRSMLQHWGERLWTLPEALLINPQRPISIYRRGFDEPLVVPKKQFATLAWVDSKMTRQLIDHYEGNLTLSRLELVLIALQSLFSRKTTEYLPGDHSYALMGLLRIRPKIDRTDSSFQAFARLSLANDSDMLLERLMCILPENPDQHWSSVSDAFGVSLWDIYPTCQIAGICENDSVLVDGAFGATIHWDKFRKVANYRRVRSFKRLATQTFLHGAPYFLAVGLVLYRSAWDAKAFMDSINEIDDKLYIKRSETVEIVRRWMIFLGALGFLFIGAACIVFVTAPYLTQILYRGKFWGTQAWLFGFEGYADIETIESQIFGSGMRRLRWSPYGSSLSRHRKNEFDECIGVDPIADPLIRQQVDDAIASCQPDHQRIFTLIDTNTMTVTLFAAKKPPIAVLLCGAEGGMQRAIACSYDWSTKTCYRETVLRMESTVLEKMSRVSRFRLGIKGE